MTSSSNFHAGSASSQEYLYDINVPTPSAAERALTLCSGVRSGALSTIAHGGGDYPGYPYGSLVTTALHDGCPIFLISGLAEHTQNLRADARASLLLTESGDDSPLALGRVTLVGDCAELASEQRTGAQACYLAQHPQAEYYLNYGDFSFWRLAVGAVRYIGGFGRMSWITAAEWFAATPDPLATQAAAIIAHMNADHLAAMTDYCRAFTRAQDFTNVQMTGVDRYGFEMSVETSDGWRPLRLAFDEPVTTPQGVRAALVDLGQRARARLAATDT